MHVFVEAELLGVERDRGVDVVDDVADLNGGHLQSITVSQRDINVAELIYIAFVSP